MKTKIQKWGNSLAVRIPKSCVEEAQVAYGTAVDLSVDDGKIIISPQRKSGYNLEEMLREVKKENLHQEVDVGDRVRQELL